MKSTMPVEREAEVREEEPRDAHPDGAIPVFHLPEKAASLSLILKSRVIFPFLT